MDFLITFTEKPKHALKKLAIQIAKECNYELIDGVYFVYFNEINSKLIKLLNFTRGWTAAEFIVDQGKSDSSKIYDVLICPMHENCTGVCEKVHLIPSYNVNLGFFVNRLHNYVGQHFFPNSRSLEGQTIDEIMDAGYIKKTDDPNIFLINKEKIIEELKKQIKYPLVYCDKINERKCVELIESLPNEIKIKSDIEEDDFDDENIDEINVKFEGFSESTIERIKAEANIKAPIYAKAIAKELEELFKKHH
jgi:hypothetical protein